MGNGPKSSSVEAIEKVAAISDTVDPSPWVICHLKFKVCSPGNNFGGGGTGMIGNLSPALGYKQSASSWISLALTASTFYGTCEKRM